MSAAQVDDTAKCWRHLQSALFAGIIVHRLITRHPGLKGTLNLPTDEQDTPILHMYRARNALEHIDQRFDTAIKSPNISSLADWYIADTHLIVSSDEVLAGGRAFSPRLGLLFYDSEPLDMFMLDLDMLRLLHNTREAQAEVLDPLQGRSQFGGGKIVELDTDASRVEGWTWDRERALGQLAPSVPVDGRVRMWMQVEA
jgi:hypothetical protein